MMKIHLNALHGELKNSHDRIIERIVKGGKITKFST